MPEPIVIDDTRLPLVYIIWPAVHTLCKRAVKDAG
jgi:hypothetical protein